MSNWVQGYLFSAFRLGLDQLHHGQAVGAFGSFQPFFHSVTCIAQFLNLSQIGEAAMPTYERPLLAFQEEAVIDAARINVKSNDRPGGVDAKGGGTLEHDCTCARSIERSDDTVTSAHVAVSYAGRVDVNSRDRPLWADGASLRGSWPRPSAGNSDHPNSISKTTMPANPR